MLHVEAHARGRAASVARELAAEEALERLLCDVVHKLSAGVLLDRGDARLEHVRAHGARCGERDLDGKGEVLLDAAEVEVGGVEELLHGEDVLCGLFARFDARGLVAEALAQRGRGERVRVEADGGAGAARRAAHVRDEEVQRERARVEDVSAGERERVVLDAVQHPRGRQPGHVDLRRGEVEDVARVRAERARELGAQALAAPRAVAGAAEHDALRVARGWFGDGGRFRRQGLAHGRLLVPGRVEHGRHGRRVPDLNA